MENIQSAPELTPPPVIESGFVVETALVAKPVLQAVAAAVGRYDIKLGAVAGRQQHRFVHALYIFQARDSPADLVTREDDLLANFNRCRVMVQPEYLQPHSGQLYAN